MILVLIFGLWAGRFARPELPEPDNGPDVRHAQAREDTGLSLKGTVIGSRTCYAVFEDLKTGSQQLGQPGDLINGVWVQSISREGVRLVVNGRAVMLRIAGAQMPGQRIWVNPGALAEAYGGLAEIVSQVRPEPCFKKGRVIGFRLFDIRPGSLFDAIGLVNGDLIAAVDQYPLTAFKSPGSLYDYLKHKSRVGIAVVHPPDQGDALPVALNLPEKRARVPVRWADPIWHIQRAALSSNAGAAAP